MLRRASKATRQPAAQIVPLVAAGLARRSTIRIRTDESMYAITIRTS